MGLDTEKHPSIFDALMHIHNLQAVANLLIRFFITDTTGFCKLFLSFVDYFVYDLQYYLAYNVAVIFKLYYNAKHIPFKILIIFVP